jgi:hypothetical protein
MNSHLASSPEEGVIGWFSNGSGSISSSLSTRRVNQDISENNSSDNGCNNCAPGDTAH